MLKLKVNRPAIKCATNVSYGTLGRAGRLTSVIVVVAASSRLRWRSV